MAGLCDEPCGFTYMKKKILDHFGDTVIITELDGKHNVVTFKNKADAILQSFYQRNNKQMLSQCQELMLQLKILWVQVK